MEKYLSEMFDFQLFEGNEMLQALIDDVEARHGIVGGKGEPGLSKNLLDDEQLFFNAAGEEGWLEEKEDLDE